MEIGRKIRELRQKLGLTQTDLAHRINVDPTTISHYESGKRAVTIEILQKIAEALGVSLALFFSDQEVVPVSSAKRLIPLFDTNMTVGSGIFPKALQAIRSIPVDDASVDYAFIVRGKSMEPDIKDKDVVLVKVVPPDTLRNGDIVVCIYTDRFLVRRFYKCGNNIVLCSANAEYAPVVVSPHEHLEVIGRVVEVRHRLKHQRLKRRKSKP